AEILASPARVDKRCPVRALIVGDLQPRVFRLTLPAPVLNAPLGVDIVPERLLALLSVRPVAQRPRVRAPRRTLTRMLARAGRARPVGLGLAELPVALLEDDARAVHVHAP